MPADRVLSVGKTNGTTAEPVRFTIEGDGTDAHLAWLDREITTQRRTSWRDELTARRQARRDAAQAAPLPVTYSAAVASRGRGKRSIGAGITSLEAAQAACEATAEWKVLDGFGHVPQWVQVPSGDWVAGDPKATAFAVLASSGASRAAV